MSLLFSQAGDVLIFIALHPGLTAQEIRAQLFMNNRVRIYILIQKLRAAGLLETKRGRRNGRRRGNRPYRCYANLDVPFLHPCLSAPTTLRKTFASVALEGEVSRAK